MTLVEGCRNRLFPLDMYLPRSIFAIVFLAEFPDL